MLKAEVTKNSPLRIRQHIFMLLEESTSGLQSKQKDCFTFRFSLLSISSVFKSGDCCRLKQGIDKSPESNGFGAGSCSLSPSFYDFLLNPTVISIIDTPYNFQNCPLLVPDSISYLFVCKRLLSGVVVNFTLTHSRQIGVAFTYIGTEIMGAGGNSFFS